MSAYRRSDTRKHSRVVVAGGHGKIALVLQRLLAERGDVAVGLVRNPQHADDLRAVGAEPVEFDLEHGSVTDLAAHLDGADAVVFAAGAGPAVVSRARTPSSSSWAATCSSSTPCAGSSPAPDRTP